MAFGIKTKVMQDCIPENVQSKATYISRIYVVIWSLIVLWSILTSSWMPMLYFLLPQFYGKTLHKLVAFTQHAGLARNIKDHRFSTREKYLNPILSFLYWKMEYHLEHHMFPTVPAYNLKKLNKIKTGKKAINLELMVLGFIPNFPNIHQANSCIAPK